MHKQNITYTLINIILSHFVISVFSGLAFGVTHPLRFLYVEGKPEIFVLASLLIMMPLYGFLGYLFILGKNNIKGMNKGLLWGSMIFMLIMAVIYITCYILVSFRIITNAWMYYVMVNYPNALAFNNISLRVDAQNLILALSTISAPMAFYIGGMIRYSYEKVKAV